jgi:hypothetical protein
MHGEINIGAPRFGIRGYDVGRVALLEDMLDAFSGESGAHELGEALTSPSRTGPLTWSAMGGYPVIRCEITEYSRQKCGIPELNLPLRINWVPGDSKVLKARQSDDAERIE